MVKRRASAINHPRSRYYARGIRVLVDVRRGESARGVRCVYTTFLSAIANPRVRDSERRLVARGSYYRVTDYGVQWRSQEMD